MRPQILKAVCLLLVLVPCTLPAYGKATETMRAIAVQYTEFTKDFNLEYRRIFNTSQNAYQLGNYVSEQYQKRFSLYQNRAMIVHMPDGDLRKLYEATEQVVFWNIENPRYRDYLQLDFTMLTRRNLVMDKDVTIYFDILVGARLFDQARQFAQQHPDAHLPKLPVVKQATPLVPGTPTELLVSVDKDEVVRQSVDIAKGAKVVLIINPLCHFAHNGVQAINAVPKLKAIFEKDAIWLGPAGESLYFDAFQQWNRQHPKEQIGIAYLPSEWPMINSWGLPTFYFFKNGVLVEKLIGWWKTPPAGIPDSGSLPAVRSALKKIGLLP